MNGKDFYKYSLNDKTQSVEELVQSMSKLINHVEHDDELTRKSVDCEYPHSVRLMQMQSLKSLIAALEESIDSVYINKLDGIDPLEIKRLQLELLNDTASHFNVNNLARNSNGGCLYSLGCAIGRKIDSELAASLDANSTKGSTAVSNKDAFDMLPDELKMLSHTFLIEIQRLHDVTSNWDEEGLSKVGIETVERIKRKFNLN